MDDFAQAMEQTKGVCLVPLGCLEKHGNHMPLGTDVATAREVSIRAAEKEAAMVFPYIPFGIVAEVKHKQGTVAISSHLQYQMLEELCDELARNGYTKILFVNGHMAAVPDFCSIFSLPVSKKGIRMRPICGMWA